MLVRPPPPFGATIGVLPRCFPRSVPLTTTTRTTISAKTAAATVLGSPVNILAASHGRNPSQLRWQSQLLRPQAQAQIQGQTGRTTPAVAPAVRLSGRTSLPLVMRLVGVIRLASTSTSTKSSKVAVQKGKGGAAVQAQSHGQTEGLGQGQAQAHAQLPPTATDGVPQLKAPKLGEIFPWS